MRHGIELLVLAALAGGLAGCTVPAVGRTCEGMPDPVCEAQLRAAEQSSPLGSQGIVGIHVRCTVASCTEAAGAATITVSYANGETASFGTGWAVPAPAPVGTLGPTLPLPVDPVCRGVPHEWCIEMARTVAGAFGGAVPVSSIVVSCTSSCTDVAGDGTTVVHFLDGTRQEAGWGYRGGQPGATP